MPTVNVTVPYLRTSMLHIPRRDLVLSMADSLYVRINIMDVDQPEATRLLLTGGLGGPSAQMAIWSDSQGTLYDYGMALPQQGQTLWTGKGVPIIDGGAFDFSFPSGTMMNFPRRCGWSVQLNYDRQGADVLATGRIHLRPMGVAFQLATQRLRSTDNHLVHTDTDQQVLT